MRRRRAAQRRALGAGLAMALALLLGGGAAAQDMAAPPAADPAPEAPSAPPRRAPVAPQAFRSPEQGFEALVAALRAQDDRLLLRVLGEAGRPLMRSGDPVADRAARQRFLAAWDAKHAVERPSAGRAELQVGEDGWPLPIPLVARGGAWRFDAAAGRQAILDRRIGRNELDTIETLRAIAEAQQDYALTAGRQAGVRAYARRLFSRPGTQDGLIGRPRRARPRARSARWSPRRAPAAMAPGAAGARRRSPSMATFSACWSGRGPPRRAGRWTTWCASA